MNEHKPCCDRCLPHTKLGECYNPSCSCHKPDEPKAWREEFQEYMSKGYSGGADGLRCSICDNKYSGDRAIVQLCPMCKASKLGTETAQRARAEAIRECVEAAESLKKEIAHGYFAQPVRAPSHDHTWNAAIKALTDKLKGV